MSLTCDPAWVHRQLNEASASDTVVVTMEDGRVRRGKINLYIGQTFGLSDGPAVERVEKVESFVNLGRTDPVVDGIVHKMYEQED